MSVVRTVNGTSHEMSFLFDRYFQHLPLLAPISSWSDLLYRLAARHDTLNSANLIAFFSTNYQLSYYYGCIYLVLVYFASKWMHNRPAYNLRLPLALWSGALSLFSLLGALKVWPEFIGQAVSKGFVSTYTEASYHLDPSVVIWYTLFTLSKVPELMDTLFVIARKQKLIPLHWIHHTLTLVFSFFVFPDGGGVARWMVSMNLLIHTFMYSYYSLKAMRLAIPRVISVIITTLQIAQMFFGLYIHAHVLILLVRGEPANDNTMRSTLPGLILYFIFFYFFVKFFIDSYFKSKRSTSKIVLEDINNNAQHNVCKKVN